jgi:hypothetical protein
MQDLANITLQFSTNLFWDIDEETLDVEKNARFIVERVLTSGRLADWRKLVELYGLDGIKKEVVNIRYLDAITLNFCSNFFDLPKTQFRCYNQPQSIQQLWPY